MPSENQNQNDEMVQIPKESYNALLDRLDELEVAAGKPKDDGGQNYDNYDDLVKAGQPGGGEQVTGINDMSNEELLGFINEQVTNNAINPLAVQIEDIRLNQEFMRVGGMKGFEDVEELRDPILKELSNNPNMTVDKAYKLVRVDNPKSEEGEKQETEENTNNADLLRGLPKRIVSEKPGQNSDASKDKDPETMKDAARQAVEELGITDETKG